LYWRRLIFYHRNYSHFTRIRITTAPEIVYDSLIHTAIINLKKLSFKKGKIAVFVFCCLNHYRSYINNSILQLHRLQSGPTKENYISSHSKGSRVCSSAWNLLIVNRLWQSLTEGTKYCSLFHIQRLDKVFGSTWKW